MKLFKTKPKECTVMLNATYLHETFTMLCDSLILRMRIISLKTYYFAANRPLNY